MDTEIGPDGFFAHKLQTSHSLLQSPDVTSAPFLVPRRTAQTDVAARLFSNCREMAGIMNRPKESEFAKKQSVQVNEDRHHRSLVIRETVSG